MEAPRRGKSETLKFVEWAEGVVAGNREGRVAREALVSAGSTERKGCCVCRR